MSIRLTFCLQYVLLYCKLFVYIYAAFKPYYPILTMPLCGVYAVLCTFSKLDISLLLQSAKDALLTLKKRCCISSETTVGSVVGGKSNDSNIN